MAKSILGIDLGSKSIKAVELILKNNIYQLSSIGEIPIKANIKSILDKDSGDYVSMHLKKLLSDIKTRNKRAVCSIPASETIVSIIEMPVMPLEELKFAMKWQLKKVVTGYPEEKSAFWDILSQDRTYKILVVSIEKIKIAKYVEIFKNSGISLKSLEIDAIPLSRIVARYQESALIIHIGASQTTCILLESGHISLISYIKVGEESMISALMADGSEYEKAKSNLYEFGLLKFESKGKYYQKLSPLMTQIISEAKRMIGFYEEKNGREVKKIIVSGGGSYIPDMDNHLIQELSRDVTTIDPWGVISFPVTIDSQNLANLGPKFSIACGLAMSD